MEATAGSHLEQCQSILASIGKLPSDLRLSLAQAILRTLEADVAEAGRRPVPAAEATGILAAPCPTPSDEDAERMGDGYLTEQYQCSCSASSARSSASTLARISTSFWPGAMSTP